MSIFSVHCQWATWNAWADCATACASRDGSGDQTRTRTSTAESNGGAACVAADGSDTQSCSTECPSKENYIAKRYNSFTEYQSFQLIVNGVTGKDGPAVLLLVLLLMALAIKLE